MAVKAEIEKISPLFTAQNGAVYWHLVKLKGRPEEFALHTNWVHFFGELKAGDKVEYAVSKAKLEKYFLFQNLRKIEEKKLEEEMLNLVKQET